VNRIRKKLQSNSGASVMIALGLFLICIMISSVVVTAAASGSSRNVNRVEQQREYLSISSAAQTVMDELTKLTRYVGRETDTDYACNDYCSNFKEEEAVTIEYLKDGETVEIKGWKLPLENITIADVTGATDIMIPCEGVVIDEDSENDRARYITKEEELDLTYVAGLPDDIIRTELEGALADVVDKGMEKLYLTPPPHVAYEEKFTIGLSTATTNDNIKSVDCEFIMDTDYSITVKMTVPDSNYALTVFAKARTTEETIRITDGTGVDGLKCTHKVCYKYFDGGDFVYGEQEMELLGIREITTTTVTWDEPRLLKGIVEEVAGGD